jgi:hypothetical protein
MMKFNKILHQPEGKTLEFKQDLSSPKPVLKTLTAFANTAGGWLVIGVTEDRRIIWVADPLKESVPVKPFGEKDQAQVEAQDRAQVEVEAQAQVNFKILSACVQGPLSSADIAAALGHSQLSGNLRKALPRLRQAGLLAFTVPNKPMSRRQKYQLTETGRKWLNKKFRDNEGTAKR